MKTYRAAIIGCGRPLKEKGATGYGMAHRHTAGYKAQPDVKIVAVADIVEQNALLFCREHNIPKAYTDYRVMLALEKPDIVSITTWPGLHAEMVLAAMEAGVKAVHCEKPMAPSFGQAREMVAAADKMGVQLTFNHQRRMGEPFHEALGLLDAGVIGQTQVIMAQCSNLFDWGTHWFDMFEMFLHQDRALWVMGQVDTRESRKIFGITVEGQGIAHIGFEHGVHAIMVTGEKPALGASIRLVGTEGMIEIESSCGDALRYIGEDSQGWRTVPVSEGTSSLDYHILAIDEIMKALRTGARSTLDCHNALQATELIFATYESSKSRSRVDLPLQVTDSPLVTMMNEQTAETI